MITRLIDKLAIAAASVGWCAMAGIFFLVIGEVIARVLGKTIVISVEYSGYLMAALIFLGLGLVTRRDEHIQANFFVDYMPRYLRAAIKCVFSGAMTIAYVSALLWFSGRLTHLSYLNGARSQDVSMTPLVYPQLIMIVGLIVLLVCAVLGFTQLATEFIQRIREN